MSDSTSPSDTENPIYIEGIRARRSGQSDIAWAQPAASTIPPPAPLQEQSKKKQGKRSIERPTALFTLEGVPDAHITTHHFSTQDKLGLSLLRFQKKSPTQEKPRRATNAVLLIHGLTTSTDMFIMPEHYNLVSYLLDHGYNDVWSLDTRMSNRFPYNLWMHRFTMDDMALYDYPAAIACMREHIGDAALHVISHCLGSVSFMMSLFAKQVTGIASVISNSAALTPRVPAWSRVKLRLAPFVLERVLRLPYVNPRWHEDPFLSTGKILATLVSLAHRENDVHACHMLSFMWGAGYPALYRQENLHPVTHRRGGDLYGPTSVHYFRHVRKMVRNGYAVVYDPTNTKYASLPHNYFAYAHDIATPIYFVTGKDNRVFADSNIRCHQTLEERTGAGQHELKVFDGYGHQDVFMGKHCHRDIFPELVRFLDKHRRTESYQSDEELETTLGRDAPHSRPSYVRFKTVSADADDDIVGSNSESA